MRVNVIIPALNEAEAIQQVIADIPAWVQHIIVVDNGSTDDTAEIAKKAGALVVFEPQKGYGYACLAGLAKAAELNCVDVVVFLDGDYSDYPEEMDSLLRPIRAGQADLVIGSRLAGRMEPGAMLWHAYVGNRLLSWMIRLITRCQISDIGPFRAITWEAIENLVLTEGRYGWTLEMMLRTYHKGYRMVEVPVSYRPRLGKSKVSGSITSSLKASIVMLKTVARYAKP